MEPLAAAVAAVEAVAEPLAHAAGSLQRITVPAMHSANHRPRQGTTLALVTARPHAPVNPSSATVTPSATQVWKDAASSTAALRAPAAPTTSAPSTATVRPTRPAHATARPTWPRRTTPAFLVTAASMPIADLGAIARHLNRLVAGAAFLTTVTRRRTCASTTATARRSFPGRGFAFTRATLAIGSARAFRRLFDVSPSAPPFAPHPPSFLINPQPRSPTFNTPSGVK